MKVDSRQYIIITLMLFTFIPITETSYVHKTQEKIPSPTAEATAAHTTADVPVHPAIPFFFIHNTFFWLIAGSGTILFVYRSRAFYEYWLFIRRNNRWVLHEIRQENEMDIQEFLN